MKNQLSIFFLLCVVLSVFTFSQRVKAEPVSYEELINTPLEELKNIHVISVSKKSENRFKAPAAITVLMNDDIRRSGVTNVAEALRLVPGLNVAKIDSNKWAISSRGFNRQFSNKLLVLVDGRTVYTPLFSGVYWDIQNLVLADIERIEIIRGPGAALWGSNAVNGVINIITKSSEFTQGKHLSALYGNYERGAVDLRYGGNVGNNLFYRVYGNATRKDEYRNVNTFEGNEDDWYQGKAGFRLDWNKSWKEKIRLQGEIYGGQEQQVYNLPGLITPGISTPVDGDESFSGGHLIAGWTKAGENDSEQQLQVYIDYILRDMSHILDQERITFDIDYQNRFFINERNEFTWGAGYRFFHDDLEDITLPNGQEYLDYEPESSNNNLYSAFLQNNYALIPDELHLILGSKFEHNFYTDFEVQPNARVVYYPDDTQTIWASIARAIRIPTRGERGLSSIALSTPGGFVRLSADPDRNFDSEKLLALEMGYRSQPKDWFSFDISTFYNRYDELRTFEPGSSNFSNPNTLSELIAENLGFAETYGFEVEAKFSVTPYWTLQANYSFLELEAHTKKTSSDFTIASDETSSPEQQFTFLSRINLSKNIELDTNVFYVDQLSNYNISDYTRLDMRLGWRPVEGAEISLTGQNLLDDYHQEFAPFLYSGESEVGRSFFLRLNLDF